MNSLISSALPPLFSFLSSIASILQYFLSIFFFIPCHIGLWITSQTCHWLLYGIQLVNSIVAGKLPSFLNDLIEWMASSIITAQGWIDWMNQTLPLLNLPNIVKQYEKITEKYFESSNCCENNNNNNTDCNSTPSTIPNNNDNAAPIVTPPPTTATVPSTAPTSVSKSSVDNHEGKVSEKTPTPSPIAIAPPPMPIETNSPPPPTTTAPSIESPSTISQPGNNNNNTEGVEGKLNETIEKPVEEQQKEDTKPIDIAPIEKIETIEKIIEETKPTPIIEESKPTVESNTTTNNNDNEKTETPIIVESKESEKEKEKEISEEKETVSAAAAAKTHKHSSNGNNGNGNNGGGKKNKNKNKNRR